MNFNWILAVIPNKRIQIHSFIKWFSFKMNGSVKKKNLFKMRFVWNEMLFRDEKILFTLVFTAWEMKWNSFLFWSFDLLSLFLWNFWCFLSADFTFLQITAMKRTPAMSFISKYFMKRFMKDWAVTEVKIFYFVQNEV